MPDTTTPDDTTEAERLAKHLAGRHADGMALQRSVAENREAHQHEHDGPGTIRNHDRDDLGYDERDVQQVIDELAEDESTPEPDGTTEGLREHLVDTLIDSWGMPAFRHSPMTREAARQDVDAILAALATDHGDLPARMANAIENAECPHEAHEFDACSACEADAALAVRDEELARLRADVARLQNRVTALEANGAELLARAEHAEDAAQLHGERADRWRRERDAARQERDDYQDRLRKAESAYGRLDAQKRDLEGVRDRLRARAEEAEATVERMRALVDKMRHGEDPFGGSAADSADILDAALDGGE